MMTSLLRLLLIAFLAVLPDAANADQFRFVLVKRSGDQAFLGGARVDWNDGQMACFTDDHGFCEILRPPGTYEIVIAPPGLRFTLPLTFDGTSNVKTQFLRE